MASYKDFGKTSKVSLSQKRVKVKRIKPDEGLHCVVDTASTSPMWDTEKRYKNNIGYMFRHFEDDTGFHHTRMEHILIFERLHGPIPKKCCVHHRDHDRSNNSAENLMCIPVALHLE